MAEDDGQMQQDVRFEEAQYAFGTPGGLKGCMIVEQYIPVDETVTVIGCYDSQKSGLQINSARVDCRLSRAMAKRRSRCYEADGDPTVFLPWC